MMLPCHYLPEGESCILLILDPALSDCHREKPEKYRRTALCLHPATSAYQRIDWIGEGTARITDHMELLDRYLERAHGTYGSGRIASNEGRPTHVSLCVYCIGDEAMPEFPSAALEPHSLRQISVLSASHSPHLLSRRVTFREKYDIEGESFILRKSSGLSALRHLATCTLVKYKYTSWESSRESPFS